MTMPPEIASPAVAGDPSAGAQALNRPVVVGPIAVSSMDGIPLIAIVGPIHHYSGKRLRALLMQALSEAGLTIEIPE
jgi:hypothetical protein